MVLNIDFKKLLKNLVIPIAVGLVSGLLTQDGVEIFSQTAVKPVFMPPSWLFPTVWTALYILMGISAYIIDITQIDFPKQRARVLYYAQLFFNFCWSFIFFNLQAYLFAFVWIIILLILIVATTVEFYRISKSAAYLMIPYVIWVAFATVLNFSIYLLN